MIYIAVHKTVKVQGKPKMLLVDFEDVWINKISGETINLDEYDIVRYSKQN